MTNVFTNEYDGADLVSKSAVLDNLSDLYFMDERLLNFRKEIDAVYDRINKLPCYSIEEGCKSELDL